MSAQPGYAPPPEQMNTYGYGEDGRAAAGFDFDDSSIRRGFIRKVYSILMCQLLVTMGFIALFIWHEPTARWARTNPWLFWVAFAVLIVILLVLACCPAPENATELRIFSWVAFLVLIVMLLVLACCPEMRRKVPLNFIFLALFTAAQSFLLGLTASVYQSREVMMAVGITAAVCLGLTLFAFQTKWDFTMMGGALVAATMVLLLFGLIAIFIPPNNIVTLVYAALGAFIFSLYLVYDTQLMMGGKHRYSISPEEYIFAALNLYLDIVNIFLYILTIIGVSNNN